MGRPQQVQQHGTIFSQGERAAPAGMQFWEFLPGEPSLAFLGCLPPKAGREDWPGRGTSEWVHLGSETSPAWRGAGLLPRLPFMACVCVCACDRDWKGREEKREGQREIQRERQRD